MSFQRMTLIGSAPAVNSSATAARFKPVAFVLEIAQGIQLAARILESFEQLHGFVQFLGAAEDHLRLFLCLRADRFDGVAGNVARGLVDVVAHVVDRSREEIDVVPVERRHERPVEEVDHLAGEPVAFVLELLHRPQVRSVRGEFVKQVDQLARDADRIGGRALEEPEELPVLRDQRDTCHGAPLSG